MKPILNRIFNIERAYAHCDIPCGIYDPYPAQMDAHTIVRMMDLINGLDVNDPQKDIKFSRYLATKEEHGEALKNKIRVIFGDFLTPGKGIEENHPNLVDLVRSIHIQASVARQTSNKEAGLKLLDSVLEFSEIFWKVKGNSTRRITAPYPSGGQIVLPE